MRVFRGFESLPLFGGGAVCTVGSYDGVHIGHRELIRECYTRAADLGAESVVLTFEPHPRIVLGRAEGLKLLTTLDEKIELLSDLGVDNLIVIPFDREFSKLKYRDFIEQYLIEKVNMKCMVVGYNHLFGHKNEGNYQQLCRLSEEHNFAVVELSELRNDDSKVSSTTIRKLLEQGCMERAAQHLGGGYLVRRGDDPLKLLPPAGRYIALEDGVEREITIPYEGESNKIIIIKEIEIC